MKMNISVLMCMLVVLAVNAQSGEEMGTAMEIETEMEPTVESFQAFLEKSQQKTVELAESDALMAISNGGIALGESVIIADKLVKAKLLTKRQAVKKVIASFKKGLAATLHIAQIKQWAQGVCTAKEFPFPADSIDMYPKYTKIMNNKLKNVCKKLELVYGEE